MSTVSAKIQNLSDDELFSQLKSYEFDVGPIMATTRRLYEKKLAKLLSGDVDVVDSTNNDHFETPEIIQKHSPLKPSAKPVTEYVTKTNNYSERQKDEDTSTRKRVTVTHYEPVQSDRSAHYNADLHVLSPRPSLRSVMSTTSTTTSTKYTTPTGSVRETTLLRETYGVPASAKNQQSPLIRFLVKLFIILVILVTIYIIYQYVYSESPFKELENLARQKLGSIQNSKDSVKKSPSNVK